MEKTYKIVSVEIGKDKKIKQSIEYYHNDVLDSKEYYDETVEIRTGYTLKK